MHELDAVH